MGVKTGLVARYGQNSFLIKYPRFFDDDYEKSVKKATFYGRLIGEDYIINLDMSFVYDDKV